MAYKDVVRTYRGVSTNTGEIESVSMVEQVWEDDEVSLVKEKITKDIYAGMKIREFDKYCGTIKMKNGTRMGKSTYDKESLAKSLLEVQKDINKLSKTAKKDLDYIEIWYYKKGKTYDSDPATIYVYDLNETKPREIIANEMKVIEYLYGKEYMKYMGYIK